MGLESKGWPLVDNKTDEEQLAAAAAASAKFEAEDREIDTLDGRIASDPLVAELVERLQSLTGNYGRGTKLVASTLLKLFRTDVWRQHRGG